MKLPADQHNCFVCGKDNPIGLKIVFCSETPGEIEAKVKLSKDFEGYPGIVHGGIVAILLDEATSRAQRSLKDRLSVTAQLNTRFRLPMVIDTEYSLKGSAGEVKGRVSKATAKIINKEGKIIAEADAVLVNIPPEKVDIIMGGNTHQVAEKE